MILRDVSLVDYKNTFIVRFWHLTIGLGAALRATPDVTAVFSAKILSVGYECELLRLRSLLLRQSLGVEVFEAVDLAAALRIARGKERVDLVVLCHTISTAHQEMIMEAAREQHGDVPVLSIRPGIFVAGTVGSPVTNDPEEFVAAVKQALQPGRHKRVKRALNLFTKESLSQNER